MSTNKTLVKGFVVWQVAMLFIQSFFVHIFCHDRRFDASQLLFRNNLFCCLDSFVEWYEKIADGIVASGESDTFFRSFPNAVKLEVDVGDTIALECCLVESIGSRRWKNVFKFVK